jgi:hypothetical protein
LRKVVCFVQDLVHEADDLVHFVRKLVCKENEVAENVDGPACNIRKAVHERNESVFSVRKLENFVCNVADDVCKSSNCAKQAGNEPVRLKTGF